MIRTLTPVFAAMLVSFLVSGASAQTVINTIAGNGAAGFSGDNAQATAAQLNQPTSVAVDAAGNVYFADTANARIRMISPAGVITTVAGNGFVGFSGDGGPATAASLNNPVGITLDSSGNLYIADYAGSIVREVSGGVINTIAGKYGLLGQEYGDGGPAVSAVLNTPSGVAVDSSKNIYIADTSDNVIRKITASSGNISIAAGTASGQGFSGDGGKATSALLNQPGAVAVDSAGNIYIADTGNNRVRMVSAASGNISTIAGNGIAGSVGDGGGSATAAELYKPSGIAVDSSGNVFIADPLTSRILEVSGGNISTVAGIGVAGFFGDGGVPTNALLKQPTGIAVDGSGNIYIADTGNNRIREVTAFTAPAPTIKPNGIVPVGSTISTVQPGEWIAIYGSNLGPAASVIWNGDFPTQLGGTSVTVDGMPAYLYYASATQVNVQVPDIANLNRSVNVVVTVGSQSVTSSVNLAAVAPSFALLDNVHVAGIIVHSDGSYNIIGPGNNTLPYKTVPAKAGDVVELFGFGFGPTTTPAPAGRLLSGNPATTNAVTLTINSVPVIPGFAGLSQAGTYQINFTVPAGLGTGDVPIVASVAGVSTSAGESGAVIALQ